MAEEGKTGKNLAMPFLNAASRFLVWFSDNQDPVTGKHWLGIGWLGACAAFGLVVCLTPARFVATSVLWLPAALCVTSVLAVGDRLPRYVAPAEGAALVIIAIGLDALICAGYSLAARLLAKRTPAPALLMRQKDSWF